MSRKKRKKKGRQGSATGTPPEIPPFVQLVVETPVAKLDLHGLTANQAARRLRDFVRTQSRLSGGKVVHIVTGRGTHSSGPAVLPGLTQAMLAGELDEFVLEIAGLPGGGAVAVRLS
jgi:DNA-nicking Smr family endonuclease